MIIYKATNKVNKKVYIGQTTKTLEKRKKQHIDRASKNISKCRKFSSAIRKYGADNFTWEILDTASTQEELNELEDKYIKQYDSINRDKGYNLKTGGIKPILSEETKRKIGDSQRGKLNHMYGIKGVNHHSSKKVYNVTDDVFYDSATICSEQTGISHSKICAVCRGDRASAGKRVFRYVVDDTIQEVKCKTTKKTKSVKNKETGEIFLSVKDAEIKYFGKTNGSVSKACKEGVYRKGYWEYVD